MPDRPTLTIELTPEQYLQVAAATGLLVNELELDVQDLLRNVAPRVQIHRLALQPAALADPQE
jgi:hypothetical protein